MKKFFKVMYWASWFFGGFFYALAVAMAVQGRWFPAVLDALAASIWMFFTRPAASRAIAAEEKYEATMKGILERSETYQKEADAAWAKITQEYQEKYK